MMVRTKRKIQEATLVEDSHHHAFVVQIRKRIHNREEAIIEDKIPNAVNESF